MPGAAPHARQKAPRRVHPGGCKRDPKPTVGALPPPTRGPTASGPAAAPSGFSPRRAGVGWASQDPSAAAGDAATHREPARPVLLTHGGRSGAAWAVRSSSEPPQLPLSLWGGRAGGRTGETAFWKVPPARRSRVFCSPAPARHPPEVPPLPPLPPPCGYLGDGAGARAAGGGAEPGRAQGRLGAGSGVAQVRLGRPRLPDGTL